MKKYYVSVLDRGKTMAETLEIDSDGNIQDVFLQAINKKNPKNILSIYILEREKEKSKKYD
jgi:hypothetical protein